MLGSSLRIRLGQVETWPPRSRRPRPAICFVHVSSITVYEASLRPDALSLGSPLSLHLESRLLKTRQWSPRQHVSDLAALSNTKRRSALLSRFWLQALAYHELTLAVARVSMSRLMPHLRIRLVTTPRMYGMTYRSVSQPRVPKSRTAGSFRHFVDVQQHMAKMLCVLRLS